MRNEREGKNLQEVIKRIEGKKIGTNETSRYYGTPASTLQWTGPEPYANFLRTQRKFAVFRRE